MLPQPRAVLAEQLALKGSELREFNGESDHVHMLIELPPTQALSPVVNSLKTVSSRLLRKWHRAEMARHFKKPVLWSRSYFINSLDDANLETVMRYIEQQGQPLQQPKMAWRAPPPTKAAAPGLPLEGALRATSGSSRQ